MNADHYAVSRRDIRSDQPANIGTEFALIGLCVASGLVGMYTENLTIMLTIFLGGLLLQVLRMQGTWMAMAVPAYLQRLKAKLKAKAEATAKAANSQAPGARSAPVLPPATDVLTLIKNRRSIFPKDYTGAKVPKEQIELLLEAANWAPTHQLTQPWRFTVLEGESKVKFEQLTLDCVSKYTVPLDKAEEAVARVAGKAKKTWPLVSHYLVISMARVSGAKGKPNPEWEELATMGAAVQAVARDAPEMAEFLGLDTAAGDKCLGVLSVGLSERADSYRGSRTPYMDKVKWCS